MNLSGYQASILDSNGYFVDSVPRKSTLAEAQAAAEHRYDAMGWVYSWRDETRLWAHHPERKFIAERLRIYELDSKGQMIF